MESKRTVQMNLFIRQRITDVKASLWLPGDKAGGEINWNGHKHTNLYKTYCCKESDTTEVTKHAHIAQGTLLNSLNDLHGDRI